MACVTPQNVPRTHSRHRDVLPVLGSGAMLVGMADHAGPEPVATVRRALRLLEAAGAHGGEATAQQLAREAGLPPATVRELLPMLIGDGYLRELEDHTYVLADDAPGGGPGAQPVPARVRPALAALRNDLGAAAYLTLYVDGEVRVMEIVDSARTPRVDLWVGLDEAGHATALGKSVLRELDDEARDDYFSRHDLTGLTPGPSRTATSWSSSSTARPRRWSWTARSTYAARPASRSRSTAASRSAPSASPSGPTGCTAPPGSARSCSRPPSVCPAGSRCPAEGPRAFSPAGSGPAAAAATPDAAAAPPPSTARH